MAGIIFGGLLEKIAIGRYKFGGYSLRKAIYSLAEPRLSRANCSRRKPATAQYYYDLFPLQRIYSADERDVIHQYVICLYRLGFVTVLSISIGKAVQEAATSLGSEQNMEANS